ncbi:MAG TPA: SHOCT domain-containing protein, partial [Candidatus Dormibacteraeota bacterium]|nr:SHOCT domain-containing protein [Candidatus Dormibacteraeota bacterium]
SPRRWVVTVLVVGATVFALVSITALWANRQFLNTDNWAKTSSELLQKGSVRTQVADFLVDELYAHVNVRGELESALPPQAKALAGPIAGGLRNVADQGINRLLQRPRVQKLWEDANRAAHKAFLKTIEGGGPNVSTTGGNVTLNLGQIAASVATSLGLGNLASKIPPDAAQITVLKSNQLAAVQDGLKALRGITLVVVLLTLLLYVIAVVVAQDRRRQALRMVGWSLIVAGVLALLVRTFLSQQVVDSLSSTASVRDAVSDTWGVATSLLVEAAQSTIAYGVVIVLGAWLAGPTRAATATRRFLAPFLQDVRWAYGAVAVVVLILIAWGPTPATRKPLGMLIFTILLCIGVEALRRKVKREFPDAPFPHIHLRLPRRRKSAVAPPEDTRLDEIERLARLRDTGVLTEEEFQQQKTGALAGRAD